MTAEIMKAKGGARAIATMTFDDGHPRTSSKLNELLPKYGSRASLMLYARKSLASKEEINLWRGILENGSLSVENHSMTHDYLTSNPQYTKPEHLCEEKYTYETKGAYDSLREAFPDQDILAFTIPYANYVPDARKHVIKTHYAALAGECVLTDPDNAGSMQSLDPPYADPDTGRTPAGCWHNVYYARLQPIYSTTVYPQLKMENILGYLDRCVEDGGWFITSCHGIYYKENQDLTEDELVMLLSRMHSYVKDNKLWVATFSDAAKYLRERQNSSLLTRVFDDRFEIDLTMSDRTNDGLPLPEDVFNMPLTVRVEIDKDSAAVRYTQGDRVSVGVAFVEDGRNYAYLELVPNGGVAVVRELKFA